MARTVRRPDPIGLVESGYTWHADEEVWLEDIVRAAAPFEVGGGVIGYTVSVGRRLSLGAFRCSEQAAERDARAVRRVIEGFSPSIARQVFAPTEFVGNATYRLARIASAAGVDLVQLTEHADTRMPQMWALVGGDPSRRAIVLCFPRAGRPSHEPFPHRARRSLGLAGAHLGAAMRLRALIAPPAADDAETEAVMTPGGKVLHAEGAAATPGARASLAQAVLASERARGRMRRAEPDEALQTWTALVRGRWTILESLDRDGKRLILARRNPLGAIGLLDLTADERDVAWLAALGHSYKYIAYELGIPIATVGGRLARAMRKLHVGSRPELLARIGLVAGGAGAGSG